MGESLQDLPIKFFCPLDKPYCEQIEEGPEGKYIHRCRWWQELQYQNEDCKIVSRWDCAVPAGSFNGYKSAQQSHATTVALESMRNETTRQTKHFVALIGAVFARANFEKRGWLPWGRGKRKKAELLEDVTKIGLLEEKK